MLKGVEAVEGHVGDLGPGREHTEDSASFAGRATVDVVGFGQAPFGFARVLPIRKPVRRHVPYSLT